jgi:hypothetical protein
VNVALGLAKSFAVCFKRLDNIWREFTGRTTLRWARKELKNLAANRGCAFWRFFYSTSS